MPFPLMQSQIIIAGEWSWNWKTQLPWKTYPFSPMIISFSWDGLIARWEFPGDGSKKKKFRENFHWKGLMVSIGNYAVNLDKQVAFFFSVQQFIWLSTVLSNHFSNFFFLLHCVMFQGIHILEGLLGIIFLSGNFLI